MKKHFALGALLLASVLCTASACVDTPGEPGTADEPVGDDTIYFDTVVTFNADGTSVVSEPRAITAGEQRAQNELRRAVEAGEIEAPTSNIAQDYGCRTDAFWLYWHTDWTGPRICFQGSGYAYLPDFPLYILINGKPSVIGNWGLQSGSYWSGTLGGDLERRSHPFFTIPGWVKPFFPYERWPFGQASPAQFVRLD